MSSEKTLSGVPLPYTTAIFCGGISRIWGSFFDDFRCAIEIPPFDFRILILAWSSALGLVSRRIAEEFWFVLEKPSLIQGKLLGRQGGLLLRLPIPPV